MPARRGALLRPPTPRQGGSDARAPSSGSHAKLTLAMLCTAAAARAVLRKPKGRGRRTSFASRSAQEDGASAPEDETDFHSLRFRGVGLLFGGDAVARMRGARAAVLGIGGVGSWVVEALARSGIGALTLVDLDDICVSNTNRQLHTLSSTIGRQKVEVMAERVRQINPDCSVHCVNDFFVEETADAILDAHPLDVVVDAIDSVTEKARLVDACQRRGIPVVVSGGLGNRANPTMFREADMTLAHGDGLLRRVRTKLRKDFGYPEGDGYPPKLSWDVPCVFSPESLPLQTADDASSDDGPPARRTCDTSYGTFCPAAGTLGFALAAAATRLVMYRPADEKLRWKGRPLRSAGGST
mmetsp:Transcript_145965/g.466525  ORF Transcript_145965/g.466525 Transcript_145965/m.466525 type:complete len:355 (+) Transcript_145965:176-1240(+)